MAAPSQEKAVDKTLSRLQTVMQRELTAEEKLLIQAAFIDGAIWKLETMGPFFTDLIYKTGAVR